MEFSKRKWGYYLTFYSANCFKIKFLYFKKGMSCSMQRHFKRNEIWCYLFGNGYFTLNEKTYPAQNGSCSMVSIGDWHKYFATRPTLVLEIQTGHCEESDIERAA